MFNMSQNLKTNQKNKTVYTRDCLGTSFVTRELQRQEFNNFTGHIIVDDVILNKLETRDVKSK